MTAHHPDCADPELIAISNAAGVQETPPLKEAALPPKPIQVEEVDLLKYQLMKSRYEHAQLRLEMYQREVLRAQTDVVEAAKASRAHYDATATKYNVDFTQMMITDDGYIVPRK